MDGHVQPEVAAGVTERTVRRMLRSAAALWAAAGLPGEGFTEALEEAREAHRAETVRIERDKDRGR